MSSKSEPMEYGLYLTLIAARFAVTDPTARLEFSRMHGVSDQEMKETADWIDRKIGPEENGTGEEGGAA